MLFYLCNLNNLGCILLSYAMSVHERNDSTYRLVLLYYEIKEPSLITSVKRHSIP